MLSIIHPWMRIILILYSLLKCQMVMLLTSDNVVSSVSCGDIFAGVLNMLINNQYIIDAVSQKTLQTNT